MAPPSADHSTTNEPLNPTATTFSPATPPSSQQPPDGEWHPSTVLSTFPLHSQPQSSTASPVPFFHLLSRLKTTPREGWRRFGINHGESIADHMYRMSIITLLCPTSLSSTLDLNRCTRMALVHDMAEALVGDITPVDGVPKPEKSRREAETMDYICTSLLGSVDGGAQGREIREVWQEYEDGKTRESHFVHDVDKVELLLQMLEYERAHEGSLDLGEFVWVAKRIEMPEVQVWAKELLEGREEFWKERGVVPGAEEAVGKETKQQQDEYYGNGHSNGGQAP